MKKVYRQGQDRHGNRARRLLEYKTVAHQAIQRKEEFITRLNRNIIREGDCRLYNGSLDRNGYPRMTFRYKGKHVTIHACRVFLILKLGKPIPKGHEASHVGCNDRRCVYHIEALHYSVNTSTDYRIPF